MAFIPLDYYAFTGLINFITAIFLIFLIFFRSSRSPAHKATSFFFFSIAWWSFFYFAWLITPEKALAVFFMRTCMIGVIFMPTSLLHFTFLLLGISDKRKLIISNYLISIIFALFVYTPFYAEGVSKHLVFPYWLIPGPVFHFALAHFLVIGSYAFYRMYQKFRTSSGIFRHQILYVFIGLIFGFLGGATNFLCWYRVPRIPPVLNILVSFGISIIAYAIVKHRLMDIKIALTRAGIAFSVYALVLGIPLYLGYRYDIWKISTYFAILLATLGPFIYGYLRRRAEDMLLAEQKRYQKALKEFSSNLIFIRRVDELCQKVLDKVMSSIKLDFAAIYLKENDSFNLKDKRSEGSLDLPKEIENNSKFTTSLADSTEPVLGEYLPVLAEKLKVGLVCSLRLNGNLYGLLILGKKEENKIFTDTDIDAFSIVSAQTSLALSEIYYFQEYRKATHQKHKLEIEKARIESAFQIADAYRHELGNIINIISVSLMDLSSMGGYEPTKEDVERVRVAISRNVKRATQIFNAVKSYNENSNKELKPQKLDNLLNYALEEEKEILSKENIKLGLDITRNIEVKANNNLSSALIYLIKGAITAIDYIKPKEKLIQIKLTKNKDKALLKISDTGGDVTQDKNYRGIGIERGREGGILYFLARRIIFDHKGEFQFSSFGDNGTTFSIELPAI